MGGINYSWFIRVPEVPVPGELNILSGSIQISCCEKLVIDTGTFRESTGSGNVRPWNPLLSNGL
jgi:hypothetical protein